MTPRKERRMKAGPAVWDLLSTKRSWVRRTCWGLLANGLGCGSLSRKENYGPGVTKSDYERSCGGCHEAYKPKLKNDDEWQDFAMKHRFLSGHDEETAQLFADYLKRNN
jgi:hypothetical protein